MAATAAIGATGNVCYAWPVAQTSHEKTNYIPAGYHTVTPYLIVRDGDHALDFYKQTFTATEVMRFPEPGGKLMHAEIKVGDSLIMLGDEHPEWNTLSPQTVGGTPVSLMLYAEDADAVFDRAVAAGAKVLQPVQNQFYGVRSGTILDPFGHQWTIGTHQEDVPMEELERRAAALFGKK